MLWGGLLMLVALLSQLLYIGRDSRLPAAIVGGIGFGLFIDELGKFITSDNNYFFQPTFALIYVVLIALYLTSQALLKRRQLTSQESLANATEFLSDAAMGNLSEAKRDQALDFIARVGDTDLTAAIRHLIEIAPLKPAGRDSFLSRRSRAIRDWYGRISQEPWFPRALSALFGLQALLLLVEFVLIALLAKNAWHASHSGTLNQAANSASGLSFVAGIEIATALVAGAFVLIGIRRLAHDDTLGGYRMFERSLLVSIFVTQVIAFFESWGIALAGLGVLLPMWIGLRLVIQHEETLRARERSDPHTARLSEPQMRQRVVL